MNQKKKKKTKVDLLGNTTPVITLEVTILMTFWTVLRLLIGIVSTVILAITEQPLGYTAVVSAPRTPGNI